MKIVMADTDGSPGEELPFRGVINSLNLGTISLEEPTKFTAQVQPLRDYTEELP